ncbi:MAG: DsbC family protein [Sterolibacteriaceae bacterium]|uniref:Thiol:disulfide interchange protein n=1 Tax=Candidatus Methylophosphatis roskildensis TaxID=2899263 RepID=A0A9D7HR82_9PROT|nr:DsbC family protein [Candidatus Methylophosphatis roskildensis]
MSTRLGSFVLAFMLAGIGCQAHSAASEERLMAELKKRFPKTEFTAVHETDIPDLFEVWMGQNVAYVSSRNPRYFVLGRVFDTQTLKDVTGPKLAKAQVSESEPPTVDLRTLPLGDAIKTVRGRGARTLVVFSDPGCPYCKQLEAELAKLADVTIYTFLLPFQGAETPAAIWCAADRLQAWQRFMATGDSAPLALSPKCAHPLDRNLALARRLDVNGTPTLFLADGSRLSGYAQAAELEARLKQAGKEVSRAPSPMPKEPL